MLHTVTKLSHFYLRAKQPIRIAQQKIFFPKLIIFPAINYFTSFETVDMETEGCDGTVKDGKLQIIFRSAENLLPMPFSH